MFNLVRESVTEVSAVPNQQNWPIRITATMTAGGAAASVFVYQTAAAPVADRDFFSCVAGAPQMTELPVGAGAPGLPYYRTNTLLAHCRSAEHADEFWRKIQRAVQDLADNLSLVSELSVTETVTILPNA